MFNMANSWKIIVGLAVVIAIATGAFILAPWKDKTNPDDPDVPAGPGFREHAAEAGIDFHMSFLPAEQGENFKINLYDHGCGVAVADFDGDGYDDIYLVNQLGLNGLYRNRGDGTFENVTEKAGVGVGDRICVGAAWGDYDNSGHPSLFVTTTRGGNILFHNEGNGTFKRVDMAKAGLELDRPRHAQTAVFFDYDNDGYLDLFVTNTAEWTLKEKDEANHYYPGPAGLWNLATSPKEKNTLYHNNGDGTFTDVTEQAGLEGKGWGGDVAVFDYDGDGFADLFVTNMFGASQLYRNKGDGTFRDVTKEVLGKTSFGAIGAKAFDSRNEGKLDLFVTDMHSDMWLDMKRDPRKLPRAELEKKYPYFTGKEGNRPTLMKDEEVAKEKLDIKYDEVVFGNTFYKQQAQGEFQEVSDAIGLETWWPWGIVTGDFDNDGYEDIFIPSGMGYPFYYWPNALMMNQRDGTFRDRAAMRGIDPPPGGTEMDVTIRGRKAARSSRSAAVADFRHNGRLDIIVNNFNDSPFYFQNEFPQKNWIEFQLTGAMRPGDAPDKKHKKSNRDGVGALIKITMGDEVMLRQVQGAGGYLSQSSLTVHFGLGDRKKVDKVEVHWPSGKTQVIENPTINERRNVDEPRE